MACLIVLLLTVPGTENSESDADKDAQEQLWDEKKVSVGQRRAAQCSRVMHKSWLNSTFFFSFSLLLCFFFFFALG